MHKIYVTLPAASRHQSSNCPGLEAAAEQQPKPTIQQAVDKQETQTDVSPAPAVGGLSRRLRYMYLHLPFFSCRKVYNNVFECIDAGIFGHHLAPFAWRDLEESGGI